MCSMYVGFFVSNKDVVQNVKYRDTIKTLIPKICNIRIT